MKNVLLMIRNAAFAVAIAVALCFGAAEALSGSTFPDNPCQFPEKWCDDDSYCEYEAGICDPPLYFGGTCDHYYECCVCFE
ncbi:MAG: hypothetical protein PVJ64_04895 [Gemmatimonadales bacterium]|jgi:hypothetical protein